MNGEDGRGEKKEKRKKKQDRKKETKTERDFPKTETNLKF